ncbi:glutathione S-transferase domain-containing protein [Schizosaccharomyces cryophilus OY26]|uniref:Glutathione S-transferase domain-containing protein n=1 Tax=Schizosaccharomyces cryophilus (strain OY26 / ATCC MYA-4695 / CBS 11777 / NBRC 106824 / NRRL Y48691) TaxID=653667 RepID=S9XET4_SCHCR|nr:glutathione S-transferase domain-containing protein [Schizosaccharomyces cryophilus OY26]EPY52286.1 glutathione S-transferase domain-containing protein [Schizosaccharomyces cryophilus OY26]
MAFGTVYGSVKSPRVGMVLSTAALLGLPVENASNTLPGSFPKGLAEKFPIQKIPVFVGADGICLWQSIAIASFFASYDPLGIVGGATALAKAEVLMWACFFNQEFYDAVIPWVAGRMRSIPYDPKTEEKAKKNTFSIFAVLERQVKDKEFLVGEDPTIADAAAVASLYFVLSSVMTKDELAKFPEIQRYYINAYPKLKFDQLCGPLQLLSEPVPIPKAPPSPILTCDEL